MLSEKRNMDAAKRFFQQVLQTVGHAPERVTTDGHTSYPRAIREILGVTEMAWPDYLKTDATTRAVVDELRALDKK